MGFSRSNTWQLHDHIIDGVPHFGSPQTGTDYIPRPSVYAIIQDTNQRIAIVKHNGAYFIPGGGIQSGETQIGALQREVLEELGRGFTASKAPFTKQS